MGALDGGGEGRGAVELQSRTAEIGSDKDRVTGGLAKASVLTVFHCRACGLLLLPRRLDVTLSAPTTPSPQVPQPPVCAHSLARP